MKDRCRSVQNHLRSMRTSGMDVAQREMLTITQCNERLSLLMTARRVDLAGKGAHLKPPC